MLQGNIDTCLRGTLRRRLLIFALLSVLAVLNSCKGGGGGSSTTTTTPTNSVICTPSQVAVNGQSQCIATINGLSSTLVGTWEVAGVAGGDATHGTISTAGLYTAPATVPTNNNIVAITAVAQAQTTLTGNANITILVPTSINFVICQDSGTQTLTISSGRSLACSATASGGSVIPAFWKVDSVRGGAAATGFISPQGVYVAPQIPPTGGTVTITAVSQADSTQTQTVTVDVTFGTAALQGAYAFSTSGTVVAGTTFFARAGSFTAGGNGTLIGGVEDYNQVGQAAGNTQHFFTGTYSIGTDGRGTMRFCEDINTTCTTGAATAFFSFAVFSAQQAQMIEFSKPNSSVALKVGSGEMDLQPSDASSFNNGGLIDTYSFSFAGVSSAATPQSEVGEFTADGQGGIKANSSSSPGRMDINGVTQTFAASTYSISGNGRGTATIGSSTFSFYIVSSSRAKFIEIDTSSILVGDAFKQQVSPSSPCSWGNNALNGAIVFETAGTGPGGGIADVVSLTANGSSAATAGLNDENSGGTLASGSSLGGPYNIDLCGRGDLSLGSPTSHTYVFYMISTGSALIQETTTGVVAHGLLVQLQGGPFANASFKGSYALSLTGTNAAGVTGKEEDFVGQLAASGTGNVTGGSLDINNIDSVGTTQTVVVTGGTYLPTPVGILPAGTLRATMLLNPTRNFVLYLVSPTQFFVLGTDTTSVAIGSLYKQF